MSKTKNIKAALFLRPQTHRLFWVTVAVAVLHHADHILRVDHSGWPLLPRVSPFTYSLLVYPVFLSIYLARYKPWYRVAATAFLFLFSTVAHIFFEPLRDKYHTWTYGSDLKYHINEKNLLGVNSKWLGVSSIAIAVLLFVVLMMLLISFWKDARQRKQFNA